MPYTNENVHSVTSIIEAKPLSEDYNSFFKVSDYPSVKEAVTEAVMHQNERDEVQGDKLGGYGITYIFFDKWEDIVIMPTHHYKYFILEEECSRKEWEYYSGEESDLSLSYRVEHHVDWTVPLGETLLKSHRLVLQYCEDNYGVEDAMENARLSLNNTPSTTWKFKQIDTLL